MPPTSGRNPASSYALTIAQVRDLAPGTPLLVCVMNDYGADARRNRPAERRLDQIFHVTCRGSMPRPQTRRDIGTGAWVVLEGPCLEFGLSDMVEVKRRWRRTNRYAYEPAILGLCQWPSSPGWTDTVCVVLPRHEKAINSEYPRRWPKR
jgi:hypothetical protein